MVSVLKKGFVGFTLLLMLVGTAFAIDAGNHRIPKKVEFAGKVIEPGIYKIQIVEGEEGPYIQISKGGEVIQKDLAIVIPARGTVSRPRVEIVKIAGQEFYRLRIRHGENWYYAYMEAVR